MLALMGCARIMPAPKPSIENAAALGVVSGPNLAELRLTEKDASAALASFIESCPKILVRDDPAGTLDLQEKQLNRVNRIGDFQPTPGQCPCFDLCSFVIGNKPAIGGIST